MKQSYMTIAQQQILTVVHSENDDVTLYIPLKPLVKQLGLNWAYHRRKLTEGFLEEYIRTLPVTLTKPKPKTEQMVCLPIEKIFGWIFNLESARMAPEKRERIVAFQRECYYILSGNVSLQRFFNPSLDPIQHEWPSWDEPFLTPELLDEMSLHLFGLTVEEHRKKKELKAYDLLADNMARLEKLFCIFAYDTYAKLTEVHPDISDEALAVQACECAGQALLSFELETSSTVTTRDRRSKRSFSHFKHGIDKLNAIFS